MSDYAHDNRVEVQRGLFAGEPDMYVVEPGNGDIFSVQAPNRTTGWFTGHEIGSRGMRDANLRSREEAETFVKATSRGPFDSADAAIRFLIGDPR
jgi:hypothetical protein